MKTLITNQAIMNGTYDSLPMQLESSVAEVTLVTGITATKTADRQLWSSGQLEYTVTIVNETDADYTDITFTDAIDALISVVTDSVKLDGTAVSYTFLSNELSFNIPLIEGGETVVVTFLVQKV